MTQEQNSTNQPITLEDKIAQRLKDLSNIKASYIVTFSYGEVEVREIDSEEDIQWSLR